MSKPNLTPGNWEVFPTGRTMSHDYSQPYAVANLDGNVLVAGTFADIPGGRVAAKANACLLAAAPEILDALIAALPYVESAESDPAYKAGAVVKITKQIRAAIAKANGEPQ